ARVVRPAVIRAGSGQAFAFPADAQGGTGPYTVQWAFGDGTYGSSVLGAPWTRVYGVLGTFVPRVTITDARGDVATATLEPVTVSFTPPVDSSRGPGPSVPATGGGLGWGAGGARPPGR